MSGSDDDQEGLSFDGGAAPGQWISLMHADAGGADADRQDDDEDFPILPARPRSPKGRYSSGNNSPREGPAPSESTLTAMFALISQFHPDPVDISVHWKPFIPDLIPAIGMIDAFIKVPRPDSERDDLGLTILDEPSIVQSNPQILRMELREQYGVAGPAEETDGYIGSIEDPRKNPKGLNSWLDSLEEIHRNRPPPTIIYTSAMPELEGLMEPWPEAMEEALKSLVLPDGTLDLTFDEFTRVVCSLLEIPVNGNLIESLHCLFSLYMQFEGNQYFR